MDADAFAEAIERKASEARGEEPVEEEAPELVEPPVADVPPEEPAAEEPAEAPEPEAAEPEATDEEGAAAAADEAIAELGEDATEEERETAAREAAAEFYAGRYKTREEAEEGIRQKDSTIGRLGQQVGQLRKEVEAAQEAAREQAAQEAEELDVPAWENWASTMVEQGAGEQGAIKALEEGGYAGYEIYLNRWLAARTDEGEIDTTALAQATQFNNALMMEMAEQRAQQAVAERQAEQQPEQQAPDVAAAARQIVLQRHPDIDEYEDKMTDIVHSLDPETRGWLAEQAMSGAAGTARALEYVLLQAKASRVDTQSRAQKIADEQAETAERAAKVSASVATSEATARTPQRSEAEQRALDYKNERVKAMGLQPTEE